MASVLPSDNELRELTLDQLDKLACSLSDDDREALSDALLRINGSLGRDTFSSDSESSRNVRITGHEVRFSALIGAEDWIACPMPDHWVRSMIYKAADAGCSKAQWDAWVLSEAGASEVRIAQMLGISQSAVCQRLGRARQAIWDHIDRHSIEYRVFWRESHRTAYFPPHHGPNLPDWLDPVRQGFELNPDVTTHIQQDAPGVLEVWRRGDIGCIEKHGKQCEERYPISNFRPRRMLATRRNKNIPDNF